MEKYGNDDFLQTQRIRQLDKYSISIKNMQNQNKFVGNLQSFAPPPLTFSTVFPPLYIACVAIFIILESQSEKLWHQNYKLRPQNYKLRPQNYKLRVQNLQV